MQAVGATPLRGIHSTGPVPGGSGSASTVLAGPRWSSPDRAVLRGSNAANAVVIVVIVPLAVMKSGPESVPAHWHGTTDGQEQTFRRRANVPRMRHAPTGGVGRTSQAMPLPAALALIGWIMPKLRMLCGQYAPAQSGLLQWGEAEERVPEKAVFRVVQRHSETPVCRTPERRPCGVGQHRG